MSVKIKMAVVDDQPLWRKKIKEKIEECLPDGAADVTLYESGEKLLASSRPYDAVFLDVEMNGMDGFDTARLYGSLFPECYLLILTSHAELSRKGYLVKALRYIDKTYMDEEIPEALQAIGLLSDQGEKIELHVYNEGTVLLPEKDIICVETVPHGVIVHTVTRQYRAAVTISSLDDVLNQDDFFRCHNSWIVNWKYVQCLQGADAVLENGMKAMISRKMLNEAKRRFWNYKFLRARG